MIDLCPHCLSEMVVKSGRYGLYTQCSNWKCGFKPTKAEREKAWEARKKVSKIMDKKRKQGKII